MIQIYKATNTNFDNNGDMTLFPTSCKIDTSTWQLTLEHPIDPEGRWKYILEEAVIKAPSFNGEQLFRIDEIYKEDSGIEATAYPIFYDAKDEVFLEDVRPTIKTGQEALDILMEGTKYFGETDITTANTAYYERKNLLEALVGTDSNSFINRWGGEVMYDNFKIIIKERLGSDYGLSIKYGKNIAYDGFTETIDMSEVVTRVYPKAYNGRVLSTKYVDSPLIGSYAKVRTKELEFSDIKLAEDVMEGDTEGTICSSQDDLDAALIQRCNDLFTLGLDKPKVNIKVDFILLENTTAYELYKKLEDVYLGDTVYCNHDRLGIISTARVVNVVYDCIAKKVIKAEIGNHIQDYIEKTSNVIDSMSQVINPGSKTLMGEKIAGILNLMNVSLKAQKDVAQTQDVRAILFEDLDSDSATFGAMCIGTQGIQIAKQRNETDTDWEWGTAIDFQTIYAQYIVAGTLSDKLGLNYWNLDTGEFRLSANTKVGDTTLDEYILNKVPDSDNLTQEEVFNILTNNGSIKGIYMYNGQLYVNAGYIKADTLSAISANLGTVTAGTIKGTTIDGATITGGTISSGTTINVATDLTVGNNIYAGTQSTTGTYSKYLYFSPTAYISRLNTSGGDERIGMYAKHVAIMKTYLDSSTYASITLSTLNSGSSSINLDASNVNVRGYKVAVAGDYSPLGNSDGSGIDLLWSGSSQAPSFTVSNISQYKFFLVQPGTSSSSYGTLIVCPYSSDHASAYIRGIGGYEHSSGVQIFSIRGAVSGNTISFETCWYRTNTSFTSSATQLYVRYVLGVK